MKQMAIVWTRIDDRLIHGQVASSWLSRVQAEQVIIADDEVADNEVQKSVLKLAAPGVKLHIFSVNRFIEVYNKQPIKRRTLLILPSTTTALELIEGGLDIAEINFGGMRTKAGRTVYRHDLCFNDAELAALHSIIAKGIKVDYQMAAYDNPQNILELLTKYIKE